MTVEQLRAELNDTFGIVKPWPSVYYVDAETYANVCQFIFTRRAQDPAFEYNEGIRLLIGINNSILFKNVELIHDPALDKNGFLSIEELKTLWRILAYQYISYEDPNAIELVRKIRDLIGEN